MYEVRTTADRKWELTWKEIEEEINISICNLLEIWEVEGCDIIHNSPFALLTRRRSEIIVESWIHLLIVRISIVSCAAVISHITNNKVVAIARWSRKNCRRCWRGRRLFLSCLFLHRERLLVRTMWTGKYSLLLSTPDKLRERGNLNMSSVYRLSMWDDRE